MTKNSFSSSRGTKRSIAHWADCFTLFAMMVRHCGRAAWQSIRSNEQIASPFLFRNDAFFTL
jgi:hypothetical protein